MVLVLASFVTGIVAGFLLRRIQWIERISGRLTMVAVVALLFLLGFGVGTNEEIRSHLDILGLHGFLIAVFSLAGSLLTGWIIWKIYYNRYER